MKKLFLFLLLSAGILASCSKDDGPEAGRLKLSESEVVVGSNPSSPADVIKEVTLSGITGDVSATVENSVADWCSASVSAVSSDQTATLTVTLKAYSGNTDRVAYIHVKSGIDELTLKVTQSGLAKTVKMIVVNEGGMGNGFGALTAITYDGQSEYDIFRKVNGRPMGDVAQSLTYINGAYFVALNNSKKIEVVEPQTFKSIATINYEQDGKPRFIAQINDNEAIVSDLNRQLVRIDIKNYQVLEYIDITSIGVGSIEKLIKVGNKLFGAGNTALVVFDVDNVTAGGARKIELGENIVKTAKPILDKNGKIWVMTYLGNDYEPTQNTLHCVNPDTETVERKVVPQAAATTAENVGKMVGFPGYNRMDTDRSRSKIYVPFNQMVSYSSWSGTATTHPAVYVLDVDQDAFGTEPFRQLPGVGMMYGMGISPDGQDVYLCDCLDYSKQRGWLREYKADGQETSYRVGIYPRMVYFTEYDN